jgi:hypothetical protein
MEDQKSPRARRNTLRYCAPHIFSLLFVIQGKSEIQEGQAMVRNAT